MRDRLRVATFAVVVGLALAGARADDDGDWGILPLWKPGNALFTEKGSRNFEESGPMLRSIRLSKRALAEGETCEKVLARVKARPIGERFEYGKPDRWKGWLPFDDDIDAVEKCGDYPCKIKFNEPETRAIAAKPKEGRLAETLVQIEKRMKDYEKTFRRRGYDLPEDAIDPWKVFAQKGHQFPGKIDQGKPVYFARKLRFGDGGYRPLRQVFDERTFEETGRIVRIARDVYTAHYFDGWGEWLEVRCDPAAKEILVLQDLLMEFDLLKNTDFFSVIARPKMRQGVDQESLRYQKDQAERILKP
jgi:hypothetical protein